MPKGRKGPDFSIRPAAECDQEKLARLMAEVDAPHDEAVPHLFTQTEGPEEMKKMLSAVIGDDNCALYVAEHGSRIVGMVYIYLQPGADRRTGRQGLFGVIDDIVVTSDFYGSGLGRTLIGEAQQWARERQVSQIDMNIFDINIASDYLL